MGYSNFWGHSSRGILCCGLICKETYIGQRICKSYHFYDEPTHIVFYHMNIWYAGALLLANVSRDRKFKPQSKISHSIFQSGSTTLEKWWATKHWYKHFGNPQNISWVFFGHFYTFTYSNLFACFWISKAKQKELFYQAALFVVLA